MILLPTVLLLAQLLGPTRGGGVLSSPQYPVTIPGGATSYPSLEQNSGWTGDSTFAVSGAVAPAVCEITPTGVGNPCPGAGTSGGGTFTGGGGGSTLTLSTTGISGQYSGWMAKNSITTSGQLNMVMRASYTFDSVSGIQAWEIGRRATNAAGITDNGQTQLVPISGSLLELDLVPSSSGGWQDTGCRFPTFVASTLYSEELYYINTSGGALSIKYVSLNGTLCTIPSGLQNIAGASLGWTPNEAVVAFQPDANTSAVAYNGVVTMSVWAW